jgi:hypothetical protein
LEEERREVEIRMAQVESPFNPAVEQKHEETYDFRGADAAPARRGFAPKEYDKTVANASDIFTASITGKDVLNKERIYQEIVSDVDSNRDPWIGAEVSPEGIRSGSVPSDLVKQGQRLAGATARYRSGDMSDRHYWALMDNIARATRAKYPGYREYIDNVISDVTGGTPANMLQRSIAAEASRGDDPNSEVNKTRQLWKEFLTGDNAFRRPENWDQMSYNQTMEYINDTQAVYGTRKRQLDDLTRRVQEGTANSELAAQTLNERVWTDIAFDMKPQVDEFQKELGQLIQTKRRLSPEEIESWGQRGEELRLAWHQKYNQLITNNPEAFGMVTAAQRTAQLDTIDKFVTNLTKNIQGGQWSLAGRDARILEGLTKATSLNMAQKIPEALNIAAANTLGGTAFADRYMMTADANGKMPLERSEQQLQDFRLQQLQEPSLSGNTPVEATLKDIKASTGLSQAQKQQTIDETVDKNLLALTDPEAPADVRGRAAENFFAENNANFLSFFANRDNKNPMKDTGRTQVNYFRKLNSPEVAKNMIKVRDEHPRGQDIYNMYQDWRAYSFSYVMKTELDTLKAIPTQDQTINIQFDEASGKIVSQGRSPINEAFAPKYYNKAASWVLGSRSAIDTYNEMIDSLTPTWKLEGLNPGEEARKMLSTAWNVDINNPEGIKSILAQDKGKSLWTQFWESTVGQNLSKEPQVGEALTSGGSDLDLGMTKDFKSADQVREIGRAVGELVNNATTNKDVDLRAGAGGKESLQRDIGLNKGPFKGVKGSTPTLRDSGPPEIVQARDASFSDRSSGQRTSSNVEDRRPDPKWAGLNDDQVLAEYNRLTQASIDAGRDKRTPEEKELLFELGRRGLVNIKGGDTQRGSNNSNLQFNETGMFSGATSVDEIIPILDALGKRMNYQPGQRQSTNVEDRRNEPRDLLSRVRSGETSIIDALRELVSDGEQ